LGGAEYPDRSTTIVAQAATLENGPPLVLSGPGIREAARLAPAPLPAGFVEQWEANRARFPLGADLILAAGTRIAALPRSTIIAKGAR
jgi:alpha-D-ribose 1-methylphosphonate 5-triphosphate synthase subunit PhnH